MNVRAITSLTEVNKWNKFAYENKQKNQHSQTM